MSNPASSTPENKKRVQNSGGSGGGNGGLS
jgi:hypothetical protein